MSNQDNPTTPGGKREIETLRKELRRLQGERDDALARALRLQKKCKTMSRSLQAKGPLWHKLQRPTLFLEQAPVAIAMFDREMRYVRASRRWRSDYGLGERELNGLSHYDIFPEIPEDWKATHRRCLAGEIMRKEEDRFVRADGSIQWLRWEVQPWRDASGSIGGIIIFTEDITERKQAEDDLRQSEVRYRTTFEQAAVGMAHTAPGGRFLRVNHRLCEITGYSREELLRKTFSDITFSEDIDISRKLEKKLMAKEIPRYTIEKRYVRKDGALIWVNLNVSLVRDLAGNPLHSLGVVEDISEHKALESKLREAKEQAEEATRTKSRFLATMSHELRTPMTVILGSLEALRKSWSAPEREQLLELGDSSAHRLLGLIDDLLDISKIEARKLKIEEQPFDLRNCVRRAVEIFMLPAQKKGLNLHWSVDPELPEQVSGDPARLGQILINLVGNAVKFTRAGEVAVAVRKEEGQMVFSILDTGIGIAPDQVSQLFRPFTQVDNSLTRPFGGSGLGLAISKDLVEMMGGSISLESELGTGSTFTFVLPLNPAEERQTPQPHKAPIRTPQALKVLLAEDDPSIRNLIKIILDKRGLSVTIAENGREAIEKWRKGGVDLILMDLQMPEMNGLEATKKIRELERDEEPRTLIFALTAHVLPESRHECLAAGMDGFLSKPLRTEALDRAIESCLRTAN